MLTDHHITHVYDQGCGAFNEDQLLTGQQTFGVFDGASSLIPGLFQEKSGAWWASFLAKSAFFSEETPLQKMVSRANATIQATMEQHGVDTTKKVGRWSTSAAVFRIHDNRLEWVQTGDSLIGIIHENGQGELVSPYTNHDKGTLGRMQKLARQGVDDIKTAVMPTIMQVRERMNEDYGVLNGEEAALDFIRSGSMPTKGIKHVIAFTDGMFTPTKNSRDTFDFGAFADQFLEEGLGGILASIRTKEATDPLCHIYPRFKQHDDATAVALTLALG